VDVAQAEKDFAKAFVDIKRKLAKEGRERAGKVLTGHYIIMVTWLFIALGRMHHLGWQEVWLAVPLVLYGVLLLKYYFLLGEYIAAQIFARSVELHLVPLTQEKPK